ncbi:hypothetical protein D3C84_1266610 [compost metagenome]
MIAPPYLANLLANDELVIVPGHSGLGRTSAMVKPAVSTLAPSTPSDDDQIVASASGLLVFVSCSAR